jgi:hypothetical protein
MKPVIVPALTLLILAGCVQRQPADEPAPVLSQGEIAAQKLAEQAYKACLLKAAHFADDRKTDPASVAIIITPMCYPQFARYAAAYEEGLSRRDRKEYIRAADRLQMELADAAIAEERADTVRSASR